MDDDKEDHFISDSKSFLFSLKGGNLLKFDIIESKQKEAFKLYSSKYGNLFQFGENDMFIYKSYYTSLIYCYENSSYDYKDNGFGLIYPNQTIHFIPEQMFVIQLI